MKKEYSIGKNIRQIRKSLFLTQEEFASKIGVSRSAVQHWETAYTEPDLDAIKTIKKVFNISYDELIDGNI